MLHPIRVVGAVAAAIGALATLGPWLFHLATKNGYGIHDDLWYSLAAFIVAFVVLHANIETPSRRLPLRWWERWAFGAPCAIAVLLATYNLPTKFVDYAARANGNTSLDEYFAGLLLVQIMQFSVVTAAGASGVLLAVGCGWSATTSFISLRSASFKRQKDGR